MSYWNRDMTSITRRVMAIKQQFEYSSFFSGRATSWAEDRISLEQEKNILLDDIIYIELIVQTCIAKCILYWCWWPAGYKINIHQATVTPGDVLCSGWGGGGIETESNSRGKYCNRTNRIPADDVSLPELNGELFQAGTATVQNSWCVLCHNMI